MNNDKYRVFLKTKQGNFLMVSTPTVNGLIKKITDWLKTSGKRIMDEEVVDVEMMTLDDNGNVVQSERLPVEKVSEITSKAVLLGAR